MLPPITPERMKYYHQPRLNTPAILGSETSYGAGLLMSRFPGAPFKKPHFPPPEAIKTLMSDDLNAYE